TASASAVVMVGSRNLIASMIVLEVHSERLLQAGGGKHCKAEEDIMVVQGPVGSSEFSV
ncbi:hypothetical protein L7F22_044705, partial [Adiantum nelumboides]|nr:hypothetical protein [Adiantum nelumboides]